MFFESCSGSPGDEQVVLRRVPHVVPVGLAEVDDGMGEQVDVVRMIEVDMRQEDLVDVPGHHVPGGERRDEGASVDVVTRVKEQRALGRGHQRQIRESEEAAAPLQGVSRDEDVIGCCHHVS